MKKEKKKNFIVDCLFFQSKEPLHIYLGIFFWLNFINVCYRIFFK